MVCKLKNKWASALLSTFLALLTACGAQPETINDAEAIALGVSAQSLSITWLDQAALETPSDEMRGMIQEVRQVLLQSTIASPNTQMAATCDGDGNKFTAAFVTQASSNIYVCSASKSLGKIFLAQVLIHEALHLLGETDECEVTRIEIEIMTSAFRIPYKNAYVTACGLD